MTSHTCFGTKTALQKISVALGKNLYTLIYYIYALVVKIETNFRLSLLFMKKILLFTLCLIICSCASVVNLDKRVQNLELGMSKREVIRILDKNYNIEVMSQTPEGEFEVWHFYSSYSNDYVLHFLNGSLIEFHKHWEPIRKEVHVIDKER